MNVLHGRFFSLLLVFSFLAYPLLASAQEQGGSSEQASSSKIDTTKPDTPAPAVGPEEKKPAPAAPTQETPNPVIPPPAQASVEKQAGFSSKSAAAADTTVISSIEEIVVTASRTSSTLQKVTGAATVVTNKTIATMPRGIAADEALGLVPGVRIDNQADGERLHMSIRGQGILSEHGLRGIKVILDGISLNDPTGFVSDLYDIDWETVDRIEVLRGPAAALYGCASNAGVINIITQKGGDKPVKGMVYESNGSNGFWKSLGQLNGTKDNSSYRVSYSHTKGYGSRVHQTFWGDNASLKEVWTPSSKVTVTPIVNFSNYFNQNAEGLSQAQLHDALGPTQPNSDAIPFNEYMKTTKLTGGVVVKAAIADNQSLDVTGFLRTTRYKESNNHYVDFRTILTPGGSIQYNWDAKCSGFTNHLTVGSDLERQSVDDLWLPHLHDPTKTTEGKGEWTEDVIIPKDLPVLAAQRITQSAIGGFLQEQVDIDKLTIMGNLRYDNVGNELTDMPPDSVTKTSPLSGEANFEKVTGRVGASYSMMEALNFYASWGLGFLPPCTEELAVNPASFGGFNKNLKASQSMGEELGVRGSIGKSAYYEITGFLLNTENDFVRYRISSRPQETFYANAGDSRRLGAETFISWSPVKPLCIQVAYTYSNFIYTSTRTSSDSLENLSLPHKDQWLPNSPRHLLNAQIDYRFLDNFTIEANAQYSSLWYIYTDSKNWQISQDGYTLFNARIGYDWKIGTLSGDLSFSVKNIADKLWIAFTEPDLDNGNPNNSYQPGPGREFFGGLRVKF